MQKLDIMRFLFVQCVTMTLDNKAISNPIWRSPWGIMAKVLNCGLRVSEFEPQLHYYIHFV